MNSMCLIALLEIKFDRWKSGKEFGQIIGLLRLWLRNFLDKPDKPATAECDKAKIKLSNDASKRDGLLNVRSSAQII